MNDKFRIIVVTNGEQYYLENLTEKEALVILTNAYKCISEKNEMVTFTKDLKVNALDLEMFYVS